MAITNVYGMAIPPVHITSAVGSASATLLDAAGEQMAWVCQAPKTGSIRKVHFRTSTVTAATDTDVRIETVDATTGDPTGTLFGTDTNVTVAAASITTNTWVTSGALTADASVTKGDILAVVLAPTGSPNFLVAGNISNLTGTDMLFPYGDAKLGGSWSKLPQLSVFALEYSDGSFAYMPGVLPINPAFNTHTYNNGSTPDEYALKFSLPISVSVSGAWFQGDRDGDVDIVLYDSDGSTVLKTVSLDKDIRGATTNKTNFVYFSASQTLSASTAYRLAFKPTSATSLSIYSFDVASASLLDAMPGGQNFSHSTRTDAGAWSDTTTRRLWCGLLLDGIDIGSGGGGGAAQLINSGALVG